MSAIRISSPSNNPSCGWGTKIETAQGSDISRAVTAIDIRIRPDELITATIEIAPTFKDLAADAIFSLESLKSMASQYGYELVKRAD